MLQRSKNIRHNTRLIRYAIGGGLAALIDLFFLWFFTDVMHIYYLTSQVFAFVISCVFGFYFQKYLTFRDYSNKQMKQASAFLFFQVIGLGINLIILK
ncbi:GtrA family protein [Patescibacteria group bacterium]|nr:GtrA family protein [Patescibacteria group bacterium]